MKLTLTRKVTFLVTALVLALGVASTAFFLFSYQRGMMRATTARGTTMAEALARGVAQGIAEENLGIIQQVQSIVQADDVILAQVYSSVWLPIDSYPNDNFATPPDPEAVARLKALQGDCSIRHRGAIDFYTPVYYHHFEQPRAARFIIGYVRIRLSTRQIDASILRNLLGFFAGALAATGAAVLVLNLLVRRLILRPIRDLNEAVSAAVEGGTFRPVAVASQDEFGELSGNFNRMFAAIQDRERHLRESEELFSTAFRLSPDSVLITRLEDGRYLEVNEGFFAMSGYTAAEAVGRTSLELDIWDDPADRLRLAGALREHGVVNNLEAKFRRRDGSVFTGYMSAKILEIRGEVCLLSVTRDITEREHVTRQLQKVEKLEAVGLLAGGIAHDFNNILTAITGNISFARNHLDPGHAAWRILDKAERAAARAAELAHQLLTFAKGGQPIKKSASIRQILEESASLVLRGANVSSVLELADDLRAVEVDVGQISQVANNILINALQAMPEGGTLSIAAEPATVKPFGQIPLEPGEYVRIRITDTGCGISEEDQKRIFDPYFTTKAGGTGLGLASVHSIISRHGGHISVRSRPGAGTTFEILLPTTDQPVVSEASPAQASARAAAGHSVLVMDDEAIITEMVAEMLKHRGYRVATAADGEAAVAIYHEALAGGSAFSAVIMDLTIPGGMGGREAAERILALDPRACLVVSSGYSNDPVMAEPGRYGFRATLMKPYTIGGVVAVLGEILQPRADGLPIQPKEPWHG